MYKIIYTNGFHVIDDGMTWIRGDDIVKRAVPYNLNPNTDIDVRFVGANFDKYFNMYTGTNIHVVNDMNASLNILNENDTLNIIQDVYVLMKDFLFIVNEYGKYYRNVPVSIECCPNQNDILYFYNYNTCSEFKRLVSMVEMKIGSIDPISNGSSMKLNPVYNRSCFLPGLPNSTYMLYDEFLFGSRRGGNVIDKNMYFNILDARNGSSWDVYKNLLNYSDWEKSEFYLTSLQVFHPDISNTIGELKYALPDTSIESFDRFENDVGPDEKATILEEFRRKNLIYSTESKLLTKILKDAKTDT